MADVGAGDHRFDVEFLAISGVKESGSFAKFDPQALQVIDIACQIAGNAVLTGG